jgi:hypothetical protein
MTDTQLQLKDFAYVLKENGYKVAASKKHPFKWIHYERNGRIASISAARGGGFHFTNVHKPCYSAGTGFEALDGAELNLYNADFALATPPEFWSYKVDHYKDLEEYVNAKTNQWAEYQIL